VINQTKQMMQNHHTAHAEAHQRIGRLAALTAVHRAFHWLHLHQPQLRQWLLEMLAIPAPTFGEGARAAWFLERKRPKEWGKRERHELTGKDGGPIRTQVRLGELAPDLILTQDLCQVCAPSMERNSAASSTPA